MHTHTKNASEDQTQRTWDVAVDVSKDSLSWSAQSVDGRGRRAVEEGVVINANTEIGVWLGRMQERARAQSYDRLRVVCEPTGGYEKRLLHLAREAGCATALVNGEAVKKLQIVQSNDTGKSDCKDPGTILLLAKLDKTLTDRPLRRVFASEGAVVDSARIAPSLPSSTRPRSCTRSDHATLRDPAVEGHQAMRTSPSATMTSCMLSAPAAGLPHSPSFKQHPDRPRAGSASGDRCGSAGLPQGRRKDRKPLVPT